MSRNRITILALGLLAVFALSLNAQDTTFTPLGTQGTAFTDMSEDTSLVVGNYAPYGQLFRWTAAGGIEDIGGQGSAHCSDDGNSICGNVMDGGFDQAAIWLGGTTWQALGGIGGTSGTSMSTAYDISGDGSVVVGLGWVDAGTAHAFAWDAVNGMVDLGSLGGESSRVNAISSDGSTLVGWDQDASTGWWRAAIWRHDGTSYVEELLNPGGMAGDCQGVSSDGTWIVGNNHPDFMDNGFLWSEDTGFIDVGTLSGWLFQGHPLDVSDDGSVVVGWSGWFTDQYATIWTEESGIVDLKQYLIDNGATGLDNYTLAIASACSNDGTTIIGWAVDMMWNYEAFIATIPPIEPSPLKASVTELSAATGGIVDFTLQAGEDYAGRKYALLGTMSGTSPGTALPGGLYLPLNWDLFTDLTLLLANTPAAVNFLGILDGAGAGTAQLNTFGPIPSSSVGSTLDFAYTLYKPFDFVSNTAAVEVVQ